MLKILHLLNSMDLGGGARAVRTLLNYVPANIDFHVITLKEEGPKFVEFKSSCKNLHYANSSSDYVREYVINTGIDIVHIQGRGIFSSFEKETISKIKDKVKILYTNIFGEYELETDSLIDMYTFKSKHSLTQLFAPRCKLDISTNSNFYARHKVIPNPIDIKHFEDITPNGKEVFLYKKYLNINEDELVIGKVGSRKAIEKWSDLLLYMFPYVLKSYPKTIMLLQGVPDSRINWVKRFGDRIRVLEETTNDPELALRYTILNVFTHASKIGEQSGNSINEAEYWGKPVLVNLTRSKDNGQLEQVVSNKNGYFASSPLAYARKVNELLKNSELRKKFGVYSNRYVVDCNNALKIVEDYIKCYYSLINGSDATLSASKEEIVTYDRNYQRVKKDVERSNYWEWLHYNSLLLPSRLYWKVKDYLAHNYLLDH